MISTVAGTGNAGYTGDSGPAIAAKINGPVGIALDNAGAIFLSDSVRVRKVTAAGIISTVAGNGLTGFIGDGGPATAASIEPAKIAIDNSGQLFIADGFNHRIRKVGIEGNISTIAGTGMAGDGGDWGDPLLAGVCAASGIAVNTEGDIYFSNQCGYHVKMITTKPLGVYEANNESAGIKIAPNPSSESFTVTVVRMAGAKATITISNTAGKKIAEFAIQSGVPKACPVHLSPGTYIISAYGENGKQVSQMVVVN
jgi:hypothetical protein